MSLSPDKIKASRRLFESGRKGELWTPRNKIIAALALLYLISPIDLIPDWVVPIIGWLDDLGVIGLAALWMAKRRAPAPEPPERSTSAPQS